MFNPPHPGEFISETYLNPLGLSARALANALGVATSSVTRILAGQARVTPEMAVRLEAVLRRSAESWLRMQDAYDLWQARESVETDNLHLLDLPCFPDIFIEFRSGLRSALRCWEDFGRGRVGRVVVAGFCVAVLDVPANQDMAEQSS